MIYGHVEAVRRQLYSVAEALETATAVSSKRQHQALFGHRSGSDHWVFHFPANPLQQTLEQRPYVDIYFFNKTRTIIVADFRQPTFPHDQIVQRFAVNLRQRNPETMFPQISDFGGSTTKSLYKWALRHYDEMHVQRVVGLASTLKRPTKTVRHGAVTEAPR